MWETVSVICEQAAVVNLAPFRFILFTSWAHQALDHDGARILTFLVKITRPDLSRASWALLNGRQCDVVFCSSAICARRLSCTKLISDVISDNCGRGNAFRPFSTQYLLNSRWITKRCIYIYNRGETRQVNRIKGITQLWSNSNILIRSYFLRSIQSANAYCSRWFHKSVTNLPCIHLLVKRVTYENKEWASLVPSSRFIHLQAYDRIIFLPYLVR